MACEYLSRCPLYSHFTLEANRRFWQQSYCEGNFEACERYKLAKAGTRPSDTMLPNGKELVVTISKRDVGSGD